MHDFIFFPDTSAILLNIVWPALYVFTELWKFWYLVLGTILIETFTVKFILGFPLKKSFYVSLIANLVSGTIGVIIMMFAMGFWHSIMDNFLADGTFDRTNWIATYILMFAGSVIIEVLTIRVIYHQPSRTLWLPLLLGNLITYALIVYLMEKSHSYKDPREKSTGTINYVPLQSRFTLLDGSRLQIKGATVTISYDEEDEILNNDYGLQIRFEKNDRLVYGFQLRSIEGQASDSYGDTLTSLRLSNLEDTLYVILEQKNPSPGIGWKEPIVTDTIRFAALNLPASFIYEKKQWFSEDSTEAGD
jgi:hypothetical protein